jgi:hypothetical protein
VGAGRGRARPARPGSSPRAPRAPRGPPPGGSVDFQRFAADHAQLISKHQLHRDHVVMELSNMTGDTVLLGRRTRQQVRGGVGAGFTPAAPRSYVGAPCCWGGARGTRC